MNEPRKPYKDRSRYLTISPRGARIVSVVALGGLCLSFLLGFKTDDGADHGVTALGLVAVMSAVAGYGCAIFLVFCSYSFIADASPDDIDERELQERNAAYVWAYRYAALTLLVGYIGSDVIGKVYGDLEVTGEIVANFLRVALISSLILPATILAWRDRDAELHD